MKPQTSKRLWGVFALSPWILFFTVVPFILSKSAEMHSIAGTTNLNSIDIGFVVVGNLYILFVIICFILHLNRIKEIDTDKKWLWRGLIAFGHVFTIPVFWYLYIFKTTN